jgi:hypothetical protein
VKTLFLVRGLPGSGKSTFARKLAIINHAYHYEKDMYFIDPVTGEYKFEEDRYPAAVEWCFCQVEACLLTDATVVVSNCSLTWGSMQEYIDAGIREGHVVKIIECTKDYGCIHNVPEKTLEIMKKNFVPNSQLPLNVDHYTYPNVETFTI